MPKAGNHRSIPEWYSHIILAVSTARFNTAFLTGPTIHDRTHL
jgi:hypothetical protein